MQRMRRNVTTPAATVAGLAGEGATIMGLGLPPHPVGAMPADRLASFYSSLYHVFSAPTIYSDADGQYTGMDGVIRRVPWRAGAGRWLSDLSLWDIYRSQTPMLAVLEPVAAIDLFASMMADFNATGHVPHWVWASCETGVMPGAHGLAVLADFLVKGVPGKTAAELLPAAIAALDAQDAGDRYAELGFVPVDSRTNGASLTLDYAYDDAVGAVIAAAAGDAARAATWANRSLSYTRIWNPEPGAMCPRYANGTFPPCPPLDLPPCLLNDYYTEGDGLQYTWSVPHDLDGLRRLFPSDAAYTSLLQQMMVNTTMWPSPELPNPWYWAGNEPDVLAPWQFSVINAEAWRTQYWVRWVLDTYYQLTPDGVPGNDDFGELNAWAVWACLGLYPLTATARGTYVLSSPCFANVTLQIPSAAATAAGYAHAPELDGVSTDPSSHASTAFVPLVTIVAHNFSVSNVYVARASLNGVALSTPFVDHADLFPPLTRPRPGESVNAHAERLASGSGPSTLEFWLTSVPTVWGSGETAVPPAW